jgi:hypothetical protein
MELSQSLLEAGLLSFLSLLLLTSSPAAAQHAGHNGPRHHAHLPRMQPAQQKLQSLLQEPALGRTANHSGKPDLKEVPELGQKQVRIASDFQIVCMDSGCNLI